MLISQGEGSILVGSCCYNRTSWIGWFINRRYLFLSDLEAEKSKMKALAESVFHEGPLPGSNMAVSSHGGKGKRGLWVSYNDILIPFMSAPPL